MQFEFRCNEPGLAGDDNLVVQRGPLVFFRDNSQAERSTYPSQRRFRTALGWAGAVATRLQPCEASTASSTPGFRAKN